MPEFRVCWSASSNISFKGSTDWDEWDDEASEEEVAVALGSSGLDMALDASGFEWWVEIR